MVIKYNEKGRNTNKRERKLREKIMWNLQQKGNTVSVSAPHTTRQIYSKRTYIKKGLIKVYENFTLYDTATS
jgi:hypothetical protein